MHVEITEEIVFKLTDMVCTSLLGSQIQPSDAPAPSGQNSIFGYVSITGQWNGFVTVHCFESLARKIGEILFQKTDHALTPQETQDAMREFTNMIGGNIKGLLPEPTTLSIPKITPPGEEISFPDTKVVCESLIETLREPVQITVRMQKKMSAN